MFLCSKIHPPTDGGPIAAGHFGSAPIIAVWRPSGMRLLAIQQSWWTTAVWTTATWNRRRTTSTVSGSIRNTTVSSWKRWTPFRWTTAAVPPWSTAIPDRAIHRTAQSLPDGVRLEGNRFSLPHPGGSRCSPRLR